MLVLALREASDELDADFQRFYHIHNWRDLPARKAAALAAVMIRQPESWTHRALNPDWQWELLVNQWGVNVHDAVLWLQWSQTKEATRGRGRPRPFPRPWDKRESEYEVVPVDELERRLDEIRQS